MIDPTSSERALHMDRTEIFNQKETSGTKTDRLTDRQSQCDFDFDFDSDSDFDSVSFALELANAVYAETLKETRDVTKSEITGRRTKFW
jgi:hypothetical protein